MPSDPQVVQPDADHPQSLAELIAGAETSIERAWRKRLRDRQGVNARGEPTLRPLFAALLQGLVRELQGASADGETDELMAHLRDSCAFPAAADVEVIALEFTCLHEQLLEMWRHATHRPMAWHDLLVLQRFVDRTLNDALKQHLQDQERTLQALSQVIEETFRTPSLEGNLERVLATLLQHATTIEAAFVLLVEDGRLEVCATAGRSSDLRVGTRVSLNEEPYLTPFRDEKPVGYRRLEGDSSWVRAPGGPGERPSTFIVPLRIQDETVGLIEVRAAGGIHKHDLALTREIAKRAASFIALLQIRRDRQRALEVVERGDACCLLDRDGYVVLVNAEFESLVHRRRNEVYGRRFWNLWPETQRNQYWIELNRARDEKCVVHFEECFSSSTGVWMDVTAFPTGEGGVAVVFRDATVRKRQEQALAESESRARLLADVSRMLAPIGNDPRASAEQVMQRLEQYFNANCGLRLHGLNLFEAAPTALTITQVPRATIQIGGTRWSENHAHDPVVASVVSSYFVDSEDREPAVFDEGASVRIDRLEPPADVAAAPHRISWGLQSRARPVGVLTLERTTSQRSFTPDEVHLSREVAERIALTLDNLMLLEEAMQAVRTRDEIIAIVGHDLRSPLSAITTSAELMHRQPTVDPRHQRGVERIYSAAHRATRLIRDLMDFSLARANGFPVDALPCDLHEIVQNVVEEIRAVHPSRAVAWSAVGDAHGVWDADRIAQLASNLITNAVNYSPATTAVEVRSVGEETQVTLEVHNQGTPISPQFISEMFQPFRRQHEHKAGLGLGLYICERIVTAHRGTIEVTSTREEGTVFTVVLPKSFATWAPS